MKALVFTGIEGSNPLGFLAALGALRLAEGIWRDGRVRLRWVRDSGWRPEIAGVAVDSEQEFSDALHERGAWVPLEAFSELGNNITVSREKFAPVVSAAVETAAPEDRRGADFLSAFGSDVIEDKDKGRIEYTDLCFITGSGHQHFLGTARALAKEARAEHLREALFGPWRYADKSQSFRWDPDDAKEYALRWRDPSVGGVSSVWGANRLAFEALPLFPTVPRGRRLRTTGFATRNRAHEFTWPVWAQWAGLDTVRSLVSLRAIQEATPDRQDLAAMGVADVFRVQRVRIGQGANFKVSFRPARAV
jgi:hypothetical protein